MQKCSRTSNSYNSYTTQNHKKVGKNNNFRQKSQQTYLLVYLHTLFVKHASTVDLHRAGYNNLSPDFGKKVDQNIEVYLQMKTSSVVSQVRPVGGNCWQ